MSKQWIIFVGENHNEALALKIIFFDYEVKFVHTLRECDILIHNTGIQEPLIILEYERLRGAADFIRKLKSRLDARVIAYFPALQDEKHLVEAFNCGVDNVIKQRILNDRMLMSAVSETLRISMAETLSVLG